MKLTKDEKLRIKQWAEFQHIVKYQTVILNKIIIAIGINSFGDVSFLKVKSTSIWEQLEPKSFEGKLSRTIDKVYAKRKW